MEDSLLYPSNFIQVLIDNHYIIKFDQIVIKKTLQSINSIKKDCSIRGFTINLTSQDICDSQFVIKVKEAITEANVDPQLIAFEIREGALIDHFENAEVLMRELSSYGVKFFLDGYGVSYSNLQSVMSLPFSMIKIDKSIIFGARENERNKSILSNLIQGIGIMKIKSLAEGIETPEDFEMVTKMGVDYIQGYYFSKPLSKVDFINKYKKSSEQ